MIKILDKLEEYILVIDKNGLIKFCNKSLLDRLKLSSKELQGNNITSIMTDNNIISRIDKYIDKKININFITKENDELKVLGDITLHQWDGQEVFYIIAQQNGNDMYTKEELLHFLDNSEHSVWIKDLNGKYVYANKKTASIFGTQKENMIGNDDSCFWDKDIAKLYNGEDKKVILNKKGEVFEREIIGRNGKIMWVNSDKSPIFDRNGEVKYVAGISSEITLKKQLEIHVEESHKRLVSLDNFIKNKNTKMFSNGNLNDFTKKFLRNIGCDGVNLWIYDKNTKCLVSKYRAGIAEDLIGENYVRPINKDKVTKYNYGIIEFGNNRTKVPFNELYEIHKVKYLGYYCIKFDNEFLGVMVVTYKDTKKIKPNQDKYAKIISKQLGVIIKNHNLANEVVGEFKKRVEAEEELEHLLKTATDIMLITDIENKFLKISNGLTKILGWSAEELQKMKWTDIIHPDDLEGKLELLKEIKEEANITKNYISRYICKNGEIRWIECRCKYLESKSVFMSTAKDITKEIEMEQERKKYEENLIREQIKNEFFANISHEFKTPLNIILATLQLINKGIENNEVKVISDLNIHKYMKSMKQNSYRLLRLVNNLIDITRIDTGYYKLNLEDNNIVSIVEDISVSVAQYVQDKDITLIFDTEVEEEIIACDPDKIERIMLNLLSNAIKYTSTNGEINIYLSLNSENVIISVKDDGIGIPEDKITSVFDRFIQVDNLLTRKAEGSGIGLSLVKSLVELHGGSITVESEFRNGTKFEFLLPRKTIGTTAHLINSETTLNSKVEKCNVEFSDIYSLT